MNAIYQEKNPTVLVLFGATGDLTRKKIIPALFRLHKKKLLPPLFQVIGFSRQALSPEAFQEKVKEIVQKLPQGKTPIGKSFTALFTYVPGHFEKRSGYKKLAEFLGFRDNEWRVCSNKLFYLAVPPEYYENIMYHLAASKLTKPCSPEEGWTRIVVEKPFGKDARTAEALDTLLGKLFKEEQIYRIDHYLGKETVQNVLAFRFSNSFFEPAWSNKSIESIRVSLYESGGVSARGDFYDGVGALRDIGQNHLLQLLALFTMENPGKFDADSIRKNRAKLLHSLKIMSDREIARKTVRGQYRGYLQEEGVKKNSKTETFFRIEAAIDSPRWEGVPIYLEGGKRLKESKVEAVITFRHPVPCLCPMEKGEHYHNTLRYRIQPQEGIFASFLVKRPGQELVLEEKDFVLDYAGSYSKESFLDPYERLLLGVVQGDQTLFVSTEEILQSWKFIDPIVARWKKEIPEMQLYSPKAEPLSIANKEEKERKEILMVGLGKMGRNIAVRLAEYNWRVRGFDVSGDARKEAAKEGIRTWGSLVTAVRGLSAPRLIWLMVPAKPQGEDQKNPIDELLFGEKGLASLLEKGDIIIDGGNSHYEETQVRGRKLARLGIILIDAGVSGGPRGARHGASLMVGGKMEVIEKLEPLFKILAVPGGYLYVGDSGAGHFVKMVHNGIEYGMMQAIAEGFSLLKKSEFKLHVKKIAELYNRGSVIESRLLEWLQSGYELFGEELEKVSGKVGHLGEGEWTVHAAKKYKVPVPIIEGALQFRVQSAKKPSYTGKILTALRNQFGGHPVVPKKRR